MFFRKIFNVGEIALMYYFSRNCNYFLFQNAIGKIQKILMTMTDRYSALVSDQERAEFPTYERTNTEHVAFTTFILFYIP